MQRRDFLRTAAALSAAGLGAPAAFLSLTADAADLKRLGKAETFSYAALKGQARALSQQPYKSHAGELPKEVAALDWDQYQALQFRNDHALWGEEALRFKAKFFHLGLFFKSPVKMYEIENGQATEIAYDPAMFDYGKSGVNGKKLPKDLGFAGFRLNFHTDDTRDVAAFLGASYFRAVGGEWQYGLSARGLAIDCGAPTPEEFPNFTSYWLERPAKGSNTLTIYALLDSPSTTGAYRFLLTPGGTLVMDIDAALYPRKTIDRLGIAPCTSMYQTGENDRRMANDWRPEIHDSDGLCMNTGAGEWIWRPIANPRNLRFNAYQDENPRGFGLLQRDRNFDHYQDDGVFYDRRPSLWVEPKAGWGKGSVQLVEIPTNDETFDNIVAFWNPAKKPQPGEELLFGYRLHWGARMPSSPPSAICVATRTGLGGVVGRPRQYFSWRFAVDFAGGDLPLISGKAKVEAVISVSRGKVEITSARPLDDIRGYRAMFDLVPPDDSTTPIDIRLYLAANGQPMTETWLYQYTPPPKEDRKLV
ncbi:glucans biosynthesis protein [Hydrocarboniphaga daqingensis]|uniref:Glucans biosynthesis protein D n=1 Tax=Hydrocarboniphaga daqingensis TaxID=490188 RepID=A0A1M5RR57_9GAMM|nr:glucan biosynthesis protein D [Hydrocarboniphaga daqingensis]SHH28588.1 glucans biosynthesis protein [Hydrocarboniphaga daqingensis]